MNDVMAALIIALLVVDLLGLLVIGVRVSNQSSENRSLDGRLTKLEARVENLPTHRDLLELRSDISDMGEDVAAIKGQADAMTNMLRTISQHLLEDN